MDALVEQRRAFLARKDDSLLHAAQAVALRLCCGYDLDAVLALDDDARQAALRRIDRLIERERLKGFARHWSYDLNRHIALKQARDRLQASLQRKTAPEGAVEPKSA